MRDDWKKFEGHVLSGKFRLQKFLGSTSYGAVFLTQSPPPQPKNLAIKLIASGGNADFRAALLDRVAKLGHPISSACFLAAAAGLRTWICFSS